MTFLRQAVLIVAQDHKSARDAVETVLSAPLPASPPDLLSSSELLFRGACKLILEHPSQARGIAADLDTKDPMDPRFLQWSIRLQDQTGWEEDPSESQPSDWRFVAIHQTCHSQVSFGREDSAGTVAQYLLTSWHADEES